ncbi:MAG: hypothetical protein ACE15E_20410 [Acidobacteriota bacterium]
MSGQFTYFWGIIVPGSIILFSLLVTLWLYRKFAQEHRGNRQDGQ